MDRGKEVPGQTLDAYEYASLSVTQKSIRLIRLLPGAFGDPIFVELSTATIDHEQWPRYEALSYTWGSKENLSAISVRDCKADRRAGNDFKLVKSRSRDMSVTRNLDEALRYLRFSERIRILWVDAICINQQDVDERGRQVEIMGDIYGNAGRVVIWFGPEAMNSALAFEMLCNIGSQTKVGWNDFSFETSDNDGAKLADLSFWLKRLGKP